MRNSKTIITQTCLHSGKNYDLISTMHYDKRV